MMNARRVVQATPAIEPSEDNLIHSLYMESVHLVERLHRRLLDVVKDEFYFVRHVQLWGLQFTVIFVVLTI